jgi:cysteine-rich repeat protein
VTVGTSERHRGPCAVALAALLTACGSTGTGGTGGVAGGGAGAPGRGGSTGGSAGAPGGTGGGGMAGARGGVSGTGGGASGVAGAAGTGGGIDAGAPGPDGAAPAPKLLGKPCDGAGTLACNGNDQKQTLICQSSSWSAFTVCSDAQNCDVADGVCTDIVSDCTAHDPGYAWCVGDQLSVCGPDRVTMATTICAGLCSAGACQPPVCGDGKIEGTEECDDGNTVPGDGCEADCKLSQVIALTAGASHTCALLREGLVRCWGDNSVGQLGLGTTANLSGQPPYKNGLVPLGAPAVALTAGDSHTCALMADQSVRCWGANADGQLGLGNTNTIGDDEVPDATHAGVPLGAKATAVAAGGNDTCAILQDGSLRCWGLNDYGQLGLGNTNTIGDDEVPSAALAEVSLGDTAAAVAAGGEHTCAILGSGSVRCWGRNNVGQLGLGNTTEIGDNELPTAVAALIFPEAPFDAIVAGVTRTFLHMSNDYGVEVWGDNSDGGLGAGTTEDFTMLPATQLGNLTFDGALVPEVSAGAYHACVRTQDQLFRCWGVNDKGQLGLGTTATLGDVEAVNLAPPVDLGSDGAGHDHYVTRMATGAAHTCVLLETGALLCWGENAAGQLGLGYASTGSVDYVGGTPNTVPSMLPAVQIFPPTP